MGDKESDEGVEDRGPGLSASPAKKNLGSDKLDIDGEIELNY